MDKTKLKGVAALIAAAVAVILAAFLCMSFPMAEVHAATTYEVSSEKDLVYHMAYAKEGDTIQLNASLTMDLTDADFVRETFGSKAEPNKDVYLDATTELPAQSQTLDLNGHTLTIITGYTRCFSLTGDVTLTITDSSAERTGAIVGYSNGSLFYSGTAESSLVLQDVAVKFTEYTEGGASITPTSAVIDTVGNVTLNKVTYTPAEGGPALIGDNAGAQVFYIVNTAEELAEAVADSSYSTVMLGADITQNITVEAGRTLTLDLNGHTLTAAAVDEKAVVSNYGTLTIVNTDTANTGAIQSADGSTWYTVFNEGTMTIGAEGEGYGELEVKNNSASNPASLVENNHDCSAEDPATLTIISGTFTSMGNSSNAVKNDGYGICTIYGGTFTNEAEGGAAVMSAGTMTIYDGTFVQESDAAISNVVRNTGVGSPVAIEGGSFTGGLYNEGADGFAISGGRFDRTFNAEFLAEDAALYMPESGEGYVAVSTEPIEGMNKVVVYSGGVGYTSLQAAINANGTEVGLASDITESVTVPSAVDIRIRMNGYTLTAENDSDPVITVEGALTWVNVAGEVVGNAGVLVKDGGSITIEAAPVITFTGATNLTVEAGGSASVANGIFNGAIVNNGGTIELSGGTYANKPESDWLAGGYGAIVNENGTYDVAQLTAQITYTSDGQQVTEGFADWQTTLTRFKELSGQEGEIILTIIRVIFFESDADILTVESGMNVTLVMDKPFYPSIVNSGNLTICTNGFSGNYIAGRQVGSITNRENGTLAIEGGKFNGAIINENTAPGSVVVSGGTFMSGDLLRSILPYIADGYCVTTLTSASSGATINQAKALVEVKDGAYTLQCSSLAAANTYARYLAVEKAVTLTLLDDVAVNTVTFGGSSTSAATAWTIDLGGNTLTCEAASSYSTYATFTFGSNGYPVTYTVQGGTLLFTKGNNSRYAVTVYYGSTLILNDVNIEFASETPFADMINVAGGSTLNIESGNYYGGITRTNGTITIAEGCVFEEDIKDVLGDGLTQNESGMVVKDGAENAVAMIETETGFAYYDTLQAAVLAVEDGQTITVLADLTFNDALNIFKKDVDGRYTFTIDLNGNTITLSHGDGYPFALQVNGSRSNDSTGFGLIVKNGTIKGEANNTNAAELIRVNNQASLILEDVTIEYTAGVNCSAMVMTLGGIYTDITDPSNPVAYQHILRNVIIKATQAGGVQVEGKAILENCTIDVQKGSGNGSVYVYSAVAVSRGGTATIESGTYTSDAYGAYIFNTGGNFVINGGSFTAGEGYDVLRTDNTAKTQSITVTGGSFDGDIAIAEGTQMALSGGTYTVQLQADWLAADCAQIEADGTFTVGTEETLVTEQNAVAKIEETGVAYTSLREAFAEAKSGDTVTLLADTKLEGDRIEIGSASEESAAAFEITFDLNGYTLKIGLVAADISAEEPNYNTAALFVGYNATLNLIDSSKEGTGTIDAQEASDLTVPVAAMRAGAVLNISGGTIIVDTANESCVYAGGGGVVVINGGTFINRCAEPFIHVSDGSSPALAVNISDSYTDGGTYLTINGGTFVGRNPMLGDTNPAVTSSYMGSDVNIAQFSDGSFAAVGADEPLPEGAAYLYTVENGEVVVTVYTEEALSAAVAGDETFADNTYATVRLGTDITQSIVIEDGRDLTLDLNGKTLTNTAGDHTITNYGTLTIIDSGENGTVTNTTTSRAAVKNEGTAYLNGGTYTRTADGTWYVIENEGVMELRDITVTNLNVNDPSSLVQNNLSEKTEDPAQLTIYSGVYDCAGGNVIMNNSNGVLTIEDGTFGASNFTDVYNYQAVQNYGTLVINGGTFTANSVAVSASSYGVLETSTTINGGTFRAGSDGSAAALYIYDHDGTGFINVTINGGEFSGVYAIRSFRTDTTGESLSVAGGTFEGEIAVGGLVGFITGGSFKQQPAEELFDENYAAEYQNGYYVAVRSDALKTARANAKADVRTYAAANGISWLALEDEAATVGTETPVYTAQQAADILAAFNAIDSAMTQLAVAEARLAAMKMVDAYVEALDTYKLDMIGDLQTAAADDEETADVDESVVLPTATYSAIYNATSASEIDFYVENALAEIEAIRSLRTEISGQTQQLADLADALEAMSDGLFGDTESGTQGAFADLYTKVQDAISDAQNAIVGGSEEGSTSLASLQKYLADEIKTVVDSISRALTDSANGLEAIKEALDTLDVSDQLAGKFEEVLAAIIKAQDAITGSTGGEGGTSIGEAITEINDNTATLVDDLREALIGENGTLTQVAAAVQGLTELDIGGKFNGVLTAITNAQNAIMGVTEEDADGVNLSEVLSAVGSVNTAVTDALATMNGTLAEWQQTVADYAETLADIETALGDGEGSLYDRISTAIIAAQDAIMGSTGGEGGTSIGAAVSDLKTELSVVQQAIIDAMPNYSDQLTTISRNIEALQTLLNGNNGLAAIKKELDGVVSAIGSATSGDTSASGLFALLEAIQSGNSTIESAVTAVQNALLGTNNNGALAAISGALEEAQNDLGSLTGALLEANGGLATDITDALAAIDAITTAIGSLGTDNEELAAQIGSVVDSLESVQGAVDEIGSNLGVAVDIEETKTNAVADLEVWLNAYLDTLLGTTTDEAESGVVMLAVTLETEDGDLYGRLTQAYSEANAQLILKYYNQALTAIDNATSTTDVSTAVSTFRAQVASVDAAAQNTPSMTGVYVLLAIVLVVLIAASIVVILKNRKAAAAVAAQPAAEAAAEEKPAEEAKPEAAEEAAEAESEEADKAEEELAADDDDKEQVVIAANVRSFAEAYVELSDEQRELFNKVKEYALGKEGTSEVKLSSGDCVKLGSKQVVKLAVRRGNPVALFVLENEMLKDFRRGATTQAKLKVRATELVLREEADLETAYTMVDLSVDQIKKDAAAAKERRREQRRERRKQRLAEEAARQAEHDGSED